MMYLMTPFSTGAGDATQFVVARSVFCCRAQPVEGDGRDTIAVFVVVMEMVSAGAPGVGTTEMSLTDGEREHSN